MARRALEHWLSLRLAVPWLFAFAGGLTAQDARADGTERETLELVYRAPAGCPDEEAFVAAVNARTQRGTFVAHAEGVRRFVVDIARQGESFDGSLVVQEGQGQAAKRQIVSPRCEKVVDALVLFTSIAIDARASAVEEAPPEPESPPPAPETGRVKRQPAPKPAPAKAAWHLSAGAGGFVASGISEGAMFSAHPVVDLASDASGLSPSLRLGVVWANGDGQPAPPGQLAFRLRALTFSPCAFRFPFGAQPVASLRICALLEGGILEARPYAFVIPTSPNRPWFAAGPLARLEVPLMQKRLTFAVDVGLTAPFERQSIYVQPGSTVATVDSVGFRLMAACLFQAF